MKQRPKNLNLCTIRFPIPALISILHRVSGVVLFFMIPLVLWALDQSLASQESFLHLSDTLASPFFKCLVWLMLTPFLYHFAAGIRHLLMDVNIGIELKTGRRTAIIAVLVAFLLIVLAGVYLW